MDCHPLSYATKTNRPIGTMLTMRNGPSDYFFVLSAIYSLNLTLPM